jgi:hypothetical protein
MGEWQVRLEFLPHRPNARWRQNVLVQDFVEMNPNTMADNIIARWFIGCYVVLQNC